MKKTLIALAALAATGAFAQSSSVTLYGVVDLAVAKSTDKVITPAGTTTTSKTGLENLINGNRFGLRGTEDLGSGLKANFTLEYGVNVDNNVPAGGSPITSNRQSFVGLSGNFGEVRLGRQYTAVHDAQALYDLVNGNTFTAIGYNVMLADRVRASNAVTFTSKNYSGFSGEVQYAFGETTTTTKTDNDLNAYVNYGNGPLSVGVAVERVAKPLAALTSYSSATGANVYTNALGTAVSSFGLFGGSATDAFSLSDLAASYDFGVAKVSGQYFTAKQGTVKGKGLYLGASVPLGAVTLAGSFTPNGEITNAGTKIAKFDGYQLLATYGLSKRTTAYALFAGDKIDNQAVGSTDYKRTQYGVGLRHTF